ncbi:MAG: hypothetical protein KF838_06740 [Phycisphaeraceae bacterium]|nr:MAG: hypothetical protein KF838_06740 [Phycisphaeraceae bacterium]
MTRGGDNEVTGRRGPQVHLLIATHTTRHLDTCLASLSILSPLPDAVTVTCDVSSTEIEQLLDQVWPRVCASIARSNRPPPPLFHVSRPHQGRARLNQVRNNGVRAILSHGGRSEDLLIVIDGDMALAPDAIESYQRHLENKADVVVPYRINLTEDATGLLTADLFLNTPQDAAALLTPNSEQAQSLVARDARYKRQLWQKRWLPLIGKRHKPKLLGGHHAVRLGPLIEINGYDEEYTGYGYDDDDLARRLHQRGGLRWAIAVASIPAFHLWHPTRAPASPTRAEGYTRFSRPDLPVRAVRGIENPIDQPQPRMRRVAGLETAACHEPPTRSTDTARDFASRTKEPNSA